MATYKAIKGTNIQTIAGDPGTVQVGEIWYNSTLGKLRVGQLSGSWATGTNVPEGKDNCAGFGTQTAAVVTGGSPDTDSTFEYNGSSWTAGGTLGTDRTVFAGSGSLTAGIVFGGYAITAVTAVTEEYDGSTWTEVGDLTTPRGYLAGSTAGTQSATLAFGGNPPSTSEESETWNGTAWTEGNDLNTARHYLSGSGTSTAALAMGGAGSPAYLAVTEAYNGTSWTETGDFPAGVNRAAGGLGATSSSSIFAGGRLTDGGSAQSTSWEFDGSSWSALPAINTARITGYGTGTTTYGLLIGGNPSVVEEWTNVAAATSITSST